MYPINLRMEGRRCAVVGGGQVAWRKIVRLLDCGARITVIAPRLDPRLEAMAKEHKLVWERRTYSSGMLKGFFCVFCATDSHEVNRQAADEARGGGALVNVASAPELCDFTLPGVVRRGPLQFSVSTDGASPGFARLLREDMEKRYHEGFADFAAFLQGQRQLLMERGGDSHSREAVWQHLLNEDIVKLILDKDLDRAKDEIRNGIAGVGAEPSDSSR